ncbi:MAG: hypothetical protein L6R42_009272, partial [Xanthoria sp. 1 TBL-2021]
ECRERHRSLEIDLQHTLTELEKEQSERRQLEEQIRHLTELAVNCHDDQNRSSQKDWEVRLEQTERKFVVVLIDADAYKVRRLESLSRLTLIKNCDSFVTISRETTRQVHTSLRTSFGPKSDGGSVPSSRILHWTL